MEGDFDLDKDHHQVCLGFASQLGHYVADCLESSSILHVLLLIYLRFCIIKNPMTMDGPIRHRKVLLIVTWMIPVITKLPIVFLWDGLHLFEPLVFLTIQFLIFSAPCALFIIGLHGKTILTIKNKKQEHQDTLNLCSTATEKRFDDKVTRIITMLVLFIFICYVPFVIHRINFYVYLLTNLNELAIPGTPCLKVIDQSNAMKAFDGIAQFLFFCNSCINPLIYAKAIPE